MNKDEFWETIERVNHLVPSGDQRVVVRKMCEELKNFSPNDILDWYCILLEYNNAAYRNDLWAACSALGAHDSDDGFIDFRTWLISQGKNVYMDAMRNPDTLAKNLHSGSEMNFESFTSCATEVYKEKLSLAGKDGIIKLYDDLYAHELSDRVIKEIRNEIPQHQDISSFRLPSDYSFLFPNIWIRMKSCRSEFDAQKHELDNYLSLTELVHAHIYHNTRCSECSFECTPYNIANFIGSHSSADRIVLTDMMDRLLLDTQGGFIDTCPDKELLEDVKRYLIPIQMGKVQPEAVPCDAMTEQEDEMEKEAGEELVTIHRLPDGAYQLYKAKVPDCLFESAPPNPLEYLEYCGLTGIQERVQDLLVPADDYHLCILTKCDEDSYSIGIIWGASHITDYIRQHADPVNISQVSELTQYLSEMPYAAPEQHGNFEMELPF